MDPPERIRILFVEDRLADVELALRELARAGLAIEHRVVERREDFMRELAAFRPDVILSDFSMPHFDGMSALAIAREKAPHTPFIFVSGMLGEEHAISALREGATDYVLKTNLVRLSPAVERALRQARDIAARREAERAMRESEAGLIRAQHMAGLAHVITGPDGSFESWSDTLPQLAGLDAARMPRNTRNWLEILHPEDRANFRDTAVEAGVEHARRDVEYRLRRADGAWIDIRQVMEPLDGQAGSAGEKRWFNTFQDVTEQKQLDRKLRRLNRVYAVLGRINALIVRVSNAEELFSEACRIAVEAGGFGVAWIGLLDRKALRLQPVAWQGIGSEHAQTMHFGVGEAAPERDTLAAQAIRSARPVISNDIEGDPRIRLKNEMLAAGLRSVIALPLLVAGEAVGTLTLVAADAGFFDEQEVKLLTELAGDIAFALDHLEKAAKLDYLAYYDALTGLANRTLFHERVSQYVHAAQQARGKLALVLMDLERFKLINDSLGRQAGDELLKQLAERLGRALSRADIARVGGDRFAIVFPGIKGRSETARKVERVWLTCFAQPFLVNDTELRVSAKAGIALYPNDGAEVEMLFSNAEAALLKGQETGERHQFHRREMTERVAEQFSLENKLRRALENNEFVLHYQPKVDLETRRIVGAEALIRWQSPELGLVPPLKFIPLMEETGMILEAGAWALSRAVADHLRWLGQGFPAPRVAVNVSPIQLRRRDFVATLGELLKRGASPPGIDLEITEGVVMEDIQGNIERLKAIQALGLSIAIDDFGTGYSSLGYLARLPIQALKIDRSFIITMLTNPDTMTLVSTMISLAHSLRLQVVAEGVDAEDQAKVLRLLRCDQMQGYLFSRPVPFEQMTEMLEGGTGGASAD
jgi:diguanylate cyclase (GGDEF)-like protein/PAS domain S-box-containing protein